MSRSPRPVAPKETVLVARPSFLVLADPTVRAVVDEPCAEASVAPSSRDDSDASLVAAMRAGEVAAEEKLYRRHAAAVLGLAARLLRSRDEAMDVMQDTFVVAFERHRLLRDPSAFKPWLVRIAVSLVHRRFRRNKLLGLLGLGRANDAVSLEELADPSATSEARAELRLLQEKLAGVRDVERAAWLLRHVEGFALEEVAEACGCSLATAKRRIAVADDLVRAHFADEVER